MGITISSFSPPPPAGADENLWLAAKKGDYKILFFVPKKGQLGADILSLKL